MSDVSRQSSPKSSPRGSRSPAYPRQDSSGTLKTTISLGKIPSVLHTGPFYLTKELPEASELTGSTNLMTHYNLEHSYTKFSGKKLRDELSDFLPHLPGNINTPGLQDNSSLRSLIDKPPITGKELHPLSGGSLTGFRLHPGPLPEQYRLSLLPQKKKKHKKHKKDGRDGISQENTDNSGDHEHKRNKKLKRSEEEKKKRKKEKKKRKEKDKEKEEKVIPMITS